MNTAVGFGIDFGSVGRPQNGESEGWPENGEAEGFPVLSGRLSFVRPLTAKSGFGIIRSVMRKGFVQSGFESTVGVACGLTGDPPPSLISHICHNTTQED